MVGLNQSEGAAMRRHTPTTYLIHITVCLSLIILVAYALDTVHASLVRDRIATHQLETIYVCEGDTMWAVARERSIEGVSTRELVAWLYEHNNLSNSCLAPGQTIVVPMPSE